MQRIIIGILMIALGFMMNWKTEAIVQFTGYNAWAEDKLGTLGQVAVCQMENTDRNKWSL